MYQKPCVHFSYESTYNSEWFVNIAPNESWLSNGEEKPPYELQSACKTSHSKINYPLEREMYFHLSERILDGGEERARKTSTIIICKKRRWMEEELIKWTWKFEEHIAHLISITVIISKIIEYKFYHLSCYVDINHVLISSSFSFWKSPWCFVLRIFLFSLSFSPRGVASFW